MRHLKLPLCGCYIIVKHQRVYLPQVQVNAYTSILSSTSRTTLTQTFTNPNKDSALEEVSYIFPLYDGVSVIGFTCTVDGCVIKGVVKERQKAKKVYKEAKDRGETAALLEQSAEAADVFTTSIGNVPAGKDVKIEITYLGELKHDAEVDGVRFTIPTQVVPRYGASPNYSCMHYQGGVREGDGISITVDAEMPDGSAIKSVRSPSHPISVSIGATSTASEAEPSLQRASATLALGSAELDKDFVIQIVATNIGDPTAILETHPTIPNQRAIMTTLVPKFNLPPERPEIVFILDRSGSMSGKIADLRTAMEIFLKSLPVGVKFNICSFGTRFDFLWYKSRTYDEDSLETAVRHVKGITANYGGTEMYKPVEETFNRRYADMNLEVFLLTDGEIWSQDSLFELINKSVKESKGAIRVFSLGIGSGASSSLIEGIARAGNGFAQSVDDHEKMDKKVVRMLRGALFPHIIDYSLSIKYEKGSSGDNEDDDFELVENVMDALKIDVEKEEQTKPVAEAPKKPISLFNPDAKDVDTEMTDAPSVDDKYSHLPAVPIPRYLQTPGEIPALYPFNRTTVYVLLSEATPEQQPKSVVLKGTSAHGPLELEIPITVLADKGTTIHQLAARKEVKELEEGRGWLLQAKDASGELLKKKHQGRFSDMVEREAVRLGVEYQVGGKWCSFVAVQANDEEEVGELEVLHDHGGQSDAFTKYSQSGIGAVKLASNRRMVRVAAPMASFGAPAGRNPAPAGRSPAPAARSRAPAARSHARACRNRAPAGYLSSSDEDEAFGLFDSGPPIASDARVCDTRADTSGSMANALSASLGLRKSSRKTASLSDDSDDDWDTEKKKTSQVGGSGRSDTLQLLISLQSFVGSWTWTQDLQTIIGMTKDDLAKLNLPIGSRDDVQATLCAVAYFKNHLAAEKDTWELVVEKAEGWLKSQFDEWEKYVTMLQGHL